MKPKIICSLFLLFLLPLTFLWGQTEDTLANYYYKLGVTALTKKDYDSAEDLFKKSLHEQENAPAEYGLAKVYRADTSHYSWNVSRQHIKRAIEIDPDNPQYHLFYAQLADDLSHTMSLEFETLEDAIDEYKKTIELDSTNVAAFEGLSGIEKELFIKWHNTKATSLSKSFYDLTYQDYIKQLLYVTNGQTGTNLENDIQSQNTDSSNGAINYFSTAEYYYKKAIKYDSLNPSSYFGLTTIYLEKDEPEEGIQFLQRLTRLSPDNMQAHLMLGLLCYKSRMIDSAYAEYKKALSLMPPIEKEDFVYSSVKVLLKSYLKSKMDEMSQGTIEQIIDLFWRLRDPLNLTSYNERLLEHYSRVAYSNLMFSVPKLGIIGWRTDRGTVLIRYGFPVKISRITITVSSSYTDINRPFNALTRTKTVPKTEIWFYTDKVFSFTDDFRNGEYVYGVPGNTSYLEDAQQFVKKLEATQPEEYHPKFNGPVFVAPNKAYQLKDFRNVNMTDMFISYAIKPQEQPDVNKDYNYKHTTGIFFFDNYFNKIAENKSDVDYLNYENKIQIPDSGDLFVNTEELSAKPDSGNLSFEIIRDKDKGVAAYHGKFKLGSFNSPSLEISDIVLASKVDMGIEISGRINRKDYSILPNPTGIFSKNQDLFLYYEVYNLAKDEKDLTNFEQTIILKKKGEEGISIGKLVGSVLKFIGVKGEEQQIGLTSKYQTKDKDSQIYLQLDMSDYEAGNYLLTVKIKDNITGKETERDVNLTWR